MLPALWLRVSVLAQVAEPTFWSVRAASDSLSEAAAPSCRPPSASVVPEPLIVPPVHVNSPFTVTVPLPVSRPLDSVKVPPTVKLPDDVSVPPEMVTF